MEFKSINPLWDLVDPLTVEQAAALIAGFDPNSIHVSGNFFENLETGLTDSDGITWVQTAFTALVNAINARLLQARLRYDAEPRYVAGIDNLKERSYFGGEDVTEVEDWATDSSYVIGKIPNWTLSTVGREHLQKWLETKGIRTGYFFPTATDAPDYLDPNNPRYAPKLAATVRAWQAVTHPGTRTPKQALEKWLREHASEFGMVDDDGNPTNQAVEECAKVANWNQGGGAPKTPGA